MLIKCFNVRMISECNKTLNVPNGAVTYNGTRLGDMATFTCDVGYIHSGDTGTTCLASESWGEYNVSCRPVGKCFINYLLNLICASASTQTWVFCAFITDSQSY